MALKNPKNCPKTQNQLEIKNLIKMICVFLGNFKVKKKKTLMRALFIKTPIKHHKKLDKPIHGFKKPKELF
jgi:hypothetical protein